MSLRGRIYNDYWMPGRWAYYKEFIETAKAHGYQFVLHRDALQAFDEGVPRIFFIRHDVDTDPVNTRTMFALEKQLGVHSTFYFRRTTVDWPLMREILAHGSEVGYHYEELSDHARRHGIRTREEALASLEEVRRTFLVNFKAFEERLGTKVRTVAGHGDFVNRFLRLPNTILMNDDLRAAAGIELEAYDEKLASRLGFRAADDEYPALWKPSCLVEAIKKDIPAILVLLHPRHWQRAPLHRFRLDVQRLYQGARYRLRARP